ncbi:MAG: hypothetical protein PF447_14155 [Spirochaetaceae bacterium]|nr:hypothetical protein [Spirochaetaceae bacterium]
MSYESKIFIFPAAVCSIAHRRQNSLVDMVVGMRLNDGFGATLRAGLMEGFGGDLRPFITLDLGSMGY